MATNTLVDGLLKSPGLVLETFAENETLDLAKRVGSMLKPGDWVCLIGDLGTGKTAFVRGVGQSLRCADAVRSPTFTLIQNYKTHSGAIKHLNHVDLYRLDGKDITSLEWDALLDADGVTVVEWAEKARQFWAMEGCAVRIKHEGLDRRRLEFFPLGPRWSETLKRLKTAT